MLSSVLATSYRDPDIDGVACAFAYAELLRHRGIDAMATVLGTPHIEARHVAERFGISLPQEVDPRNYEKIVLLDTSNLSDQDPRLPMDRVIQIIDHRRLHEGEKFPQATLQIELVGSAATLVAEHFFADGLTPTRDSAFLLFGAIASNTVNFKARVTTDRDHRMATWLQSLHSFPDDFVAAMFQAKSQLDGPRLRESLLGDFSSREIGGLNIGIAQLEITHAKQLIESRYTDLLGVIEELRQAYPDNHRIFISIIDILEGYNIFLAPEPDVRVALESFLRVVFDKRNVAYHQSILMRKEIGPLWKAWCEAKNAV